MPSLLPKVEVDVGDAENVVNGDRTSCQLVRSLQLEIRFCLLPYFQILRAIAAMNNRKPISST
ncbi:hypothetical protein [Nostoc sp. T09]|uniref:hypothetical protein n=1 Tax=Nostoc sp. T09 TaxID=1932621 RepID=UPI001C4FB6AA|nr:hypothetical protein [Nostoc sp. T09]